MYIGQTIHSLNHRKARHLYDSNLKKDAMHFHKAIRRYGIDSFKWKVIRVCSNINDLNKLEVFYIGSYDTFKNGYNSTEGGSNPPHTEEIKKKISKGNKGKTYTKETICRMSEVKKGNKNPMFGMTGDKNSMFGMTGNKNPMFGKTHTKEARKIISEARKISVLIEGKRFDSQKEAASFIGISPQTFYYRLRHKTKWMDYSYA